MYDMILPADQLEIAAIRGRLNCDEDTAVLTIFERRNRLINNYTYGAPSNGGGQYPPVSKSVLFISNLSLICICVMLTGFVTTNRKAKK